MSTPLVVCAMLSGQPGERDLLVSRAAGSPLYARALATLSRCGAARPVVVTDIPEAAALAAEMGIETLPPAHPVQDGQDAPLTALIARSLARRRPKPRGRTPVVLLDWRWPLITEETIAAALGAFRASGRSALVCAERTRDHPVQSHKGYKILDTGTVVFLDPKASDATWLAEFNARQRMTGNEAPYVATRPFFLEWSNFSMASRTDGDIAALSWLAQQPDQSYFFIPLARLRNTYFFQSATVGLYRRESARLARHLVSTYWLGSHYPENLTGLDPLAGMANPGALCLEQKGAALLCLPSQVTPGQVILRAWPFADGRIKPEMALEIRLEGQDARNCFLWNQTIHLAFRLPGSWALESDGFHFALMTPDNQEADYMEPLLFSNGPYRYDAHSRTLTTSGGDPITGRQQFAPVSVLSAALTILAFEDLPHAGPLPFSGGAAVFALPEEQAVSVENLIDLARIG